MSPSQEHHECLTRLHWCAFRCTQRDGCRSAPYPAGWTRASADISEGSQTREREAHEVQELLVVTRHSGSRLPLDIDGNEASGYQAGHAKTCQVAETGEHVIKAVQYYESLKDF